MPRNLEMAVGTEVSRWLRDKRPATRRAYGEDLRRIARLINKPLATLTRDDIPCLQHGLRRMAPAIQRRTVAALNSFLTHLEEEGLTVDLAFRRLRVPPMRQRQPAILTVEALHRVILNEPTLRNRLLLAMLYETGGRAGEIASLRWHNLRQGADSGIVRLRTMRSRSRRAIRISPLLWKALQRYRHGADEKDFLFPSPQGGPLDLSQVFRIVQAAGHRAQLPSLSPRGIRRAHLVHALAAGTPLPVMQQRLGYAAIATVARYVPSTSGMCGFSD